MSRWYLHILLHVASRMAFKGNVPIYTSKYYKTTRLAYGPFSILICALKHSSRALLLYS